MPFFGDFPPFQQKTETVFAIPRPIRRSRVRFYIPKSDEFSCKRTDRQVDRALAGELRASLPAEFAKAEKEKSDERNENILENQNSAWEGILRNKKEAPTALDASQLCTDVLSIAPLNVFLLGDQTQVDPMLKSAYSPSPKFPYIVTQGEEEGPHLEGEIRNNKNPKVPNSIQTLNITQNSSFLDSIIDNTDKDSEGDDKFSLKSIELQKEDSSEQEVGARALHPDSSHPSMHNDSVIEKTDYIASEVRDKASSENASVSTLSASEMDALDAKGAVFYPAQKEDFKANYQNSLIQNEKEEDRCRYINYYSTSTQGHLLSKSYVNLYLSPSLSLIAKQKATTDFNNSIEIDDNFALNSNKYDDLTLSTSNFSLKWLDTPALASIYNDLYVKKESLEKQKEGMVSPSKREEKDVITIRGTEENKNIDAISTENPEKYIDLDYMHKNQKAIFSRYKSDVFSATVRKRVSFCQMP
ncbi:unnamed protein product [Phytomonas sp. Hart1]|nr:unnamed protein product [Phytomonas sp. Hart1]|eukprot:CCW70672.1 unnamed protein product [Phytomonas sp. isolate Hart1]